MLGQCLRLSGRNVTILSYRRKLSKTTVKTWDTIIDHQIYIQPGEVIKATACHNTVHPAGSEGLAQTQAPSPGFAGLEPERDGMDAREESPPVEMALLILVTAVFPPRISGIGSYHIYVTVVIGLTGLELVATVQTCRISALVVRNALGEIAFQAMGGVPLSCWLQMFYRRWMPCATILPHHRALPGTTNTVFTFHRGCSGGAFPRATGGSGVTEHLSRHRDQVSAGQARARYTVHEAIRLYFTAWSPLYSLHGVAMPDLQ